VEEELTGLAVAVETVRGTAAGVGGAGVYVVEGVVETVEVVPVMEVVGRVGVEWAMAKVA